MATDDQVEQWLEEHEAEARLTDESQMPASDAAQEMRRQVLDGTFDVERWRSHAWSIARKYQRRPLIPSRAIRGWFWNHFYR